MITTQYDVKQQMISTDTQPMNLVAVGIGLAIPGAAVLLVLLLCCVSWRYDKLCFKAGTVSVTLISVIHVTNVTSSRIANSSTRLLCWQHCVLARMRVIRNYFKHQCRCYLMAHLSSICALRSAKPVLYLHWPALQRSPVQLNHRSCCDLS
jgi:hypothetical protein